MIGLEGLTSPRYFGKYKGFIRDNDDPEKRGRLRVFCPQIMGATDGPKNWLDWAEPCLPWLGGLSSLDFGVPPIPAQNDKIAVGVWIEFEGGNPDHPIWVGTFPYRTVTGFGKHNKIDDSVASSSPGGTIFAEAEAGNIPDTDTSDFNPVRPQNGEVRLVAKAGVDIVIMSDRGGCIVIGPNGVNISGAFVRTNGRTLEADISSILG
jgi:hypothetical protein